MFVKHPRFMRTGAANHPGDWPSLRRVPRLDPRFRRDDTCWLGRSPCSSCFEASPDPRRSGKLALILRRERDAQFWRRGELWRLDHRKLVRSDLIGDMMGWRQNLQAAESG